MAASLWPLAPGQRAWIVSCRVVFVSGAKDQYAAAKATHGPDGTLITSEAMALHYGQPMILGRVGVKFDEPFATVDWAAKETMT